MWPPNDVDSSELRRTADDVNSLALDGFEYEFCLQRGATTPCGKARRSISVSKYAGSEIRYPLPYRITVHRQPRRSSKGQA
jgi:hypothetical protein